MGLTGGTGCPGPAVGCLLHGLPAGPAKAEAPAGLRLWAADGGVMAAPLDLLSCHHQAGAPVHTVQHMEIGPVKADSLCHAMHTTLCSLEAHQLGSH